MSKKASIDDNLRQPIIGVNKTKSCACKFFTSDSGIFFFYFSKKWVGRAVGNETFYGDGLMRSALLVKLG